METEPVLLTDAVVAAAPSPNNHTLPALYNNNNNNRTMPAFVAGVRAPAGSGESSVQDFRRQMLHIGRDLNSRDIPTIKFLLRGE